MANSWTTKDERRMTNDEQVFRRSSFVRSSHVEPEMDHVAIVHHVLFAFQPDMTLGAGTGHPARGHQGGLRRNLGADEAALDVGVDTARGLERRLPGCRVQARVSLPPVMVKKVIRSSSR